MPEKSTLCKTPQRSPLFKSRSERGFSPRDTSRISGMLFDSLKSPFEGGFSPRDTSRIQGMLPFPISILPRLSFLFALIIVLLASGCAHGRKEITIPEAPRQAGWVAPLDHPNPLVTSQFGAPRGGRTHKGIDLNVPMNAPVRAVESGRVAFSGVQGAYGHLIVLDHTPELSTAYAHLHDRRVSTGEKVRQGQVIGHVGKSGNATGPHLHFEVREKGQPIDPRPYLKR